LNVKKIDIIFNGENKVEVAVVHNDGSVKFLSKVKEDKNMSQEDFALISLAAALEVNPSEKLNIPELWDYE
jgi:hypothetical protein